MLLLHLTNFLNSVPHLWEEKEEIMVIVIHFLTNLKRIVTLALNDSFEQVVQVARTNSCEG